MKKLLLFAFSVLFVLGLAARPITMHHLNTGTLFMTGADTLELYDTLGNKINNGTIKISGSDPAVENMVGYIWMKNTTSTNMTNAYVRRTVNQEVSGSMNSFCFGVNCYSPMTNVSTNPATLTAGAIDKSFYADYYPDPDGKGGLTSITFEFFDDLTFGTTVKAKATVEFSISAAGINTDKLVLKGPYPNPASQLATIEYNLPDSYRYAHVIIRNMLGVEVENIKIENHSGKEAIDVSSLASGIYFYSFFADGKILQSKKMIVKH